MTDAHQCDAMTQSRGGENSSVCGGRSGGASHIKCYSIPTVPAMKFTTLDHLCSRSMKNKFTQNSWGVVAFGGGASAARRVEFLGDHVSSVPL